MKELEQKLDIARNSRLALIENFFSQRKDIVFHGISTVFTRKEHKEMEVSKKLWRGSVGGASDIARSIRDSDKFQPRETFLRNILFFLMAILLILFVLLYVY